LAKDVDIEDMIKDLHMKLEELTFKNETDLQQMLQSMLTPKEVFLNTVFLMQDSANIFQLTPAERLNVLKNVFNLLSIDEGKEVIAEKKREIYYKLKATADTSKYDSRLK
jgi:DNA repair exonuclease SbcCD ATPase subunit